MVSELIQLFGQPFPDQLMAIQLVHRQRREIVDRIAPFARFDALPFEPVALGCVQPKVQGFDRFRLEHSLSLDLRLSPLQGHRQPQAGSLGLTLQLHLEVSARIQQATVATDRSRCGCGLKIASIQRIGRWLDLQLFHGLGSQLLFQQAQPLLDGWTRGKRIAAAFIATVPADQQVLPR